MKSMFRFSPLLLVITCSPAGERTTRLTLDESGGLRLDHGELVLTLDRDLRPDLRFRGTSVLRNPEAGTDPICFVEADGIQLADFSIQGPVPQLESITDYHGKGYRMRLLALSGMRLEARLALNLDLTAYERYPTALVMKISLENLSDQSTVHLERVHGAVLELDGSRNQPGNPRFGFHAFQGAGYEWGRSYAAIPLTEDFAQKNFMGLYRRGGPAEPEDEGGGINLIDAWNRTSGLALCHLALQDLFVSLPTEVADDGYVHMSIHEELDESLGRPALLRPRDRYDFPAPIALIAHSGDYFEPLRLYRDLLMDQGLAVQTDSPEWTYQSYWKTWGWKRDFTLQMVYDRIPQLLELGIRQLQIDDGWQDHVGDWNPNAEKYKGGEGTVRESVDKMKSLGIERVYLWWNPLGVDTDSEMARRRDWLVLGPEGSPPTARQHSLCPAYPPVQEHLRSLVRKWIGEWGYDGVYNDFAMNSVAPACFNPAHQHTSPVEAFAATPEVWKVIWDEAHALHPAPFLETCICSLPHSLFKNPYTNMTSASDPLTNFQVRARIKVEKAAHGPRWAYTNCYIEEGRRDPAPQLSDADFASSVGIGSILTTLYANLTPQQFEQYQKWFGIYYRELLSAGEYRNLYDIAYDRPEAHAIRKDDVMYFGFFAERWEGELELRGLENRSYRVIDYVEDRDLGRVEGPVGRLTQSFREYLLVKCVPDV